MKIIVDGVFFQVRNTGIARVWRSLLKHWSTQPFAQCITLLDRGNTAPKFPSIQSIGIPLYGLVSVDEDRQLLQQCCDEVEADLFVSTYYTTPISTPSIFFGHDMIPELMGVDLNVPMWQDKHRAISQGIAHVVVSENTKKDLQTLFPKTQNEPVTVAHCGLSPEFFPPSPEVVKGFRSRHNLHKPYVLWVGERLGFNGYKNSALVFKAMKLWERQLDFSVVCTGDGSPLEPPLAQLAQGLDVRSLCLSEGELVAAYGGAHCLAYTSRYEGFGLPLLEAMGCDCPVVTCPSGSIPEVAGDGALFVSPDQPMELMTAFERLMRPDHRQSLIQRGRLRAQQFSWGTMADTVAQAFGETVAMAGDQGNNRGAIIPDNPDLGGEGVGEQSNINETINEPNYRLKGESNLVSTVMSAGAEALDVNQLNVNQLDVNQAIATLKAYSQEPQNLQRLKQVRTLRQQLIEPALMLGTAVQVTMEGLDQIWTGEYATLHQALRHSGLIHEPLNSEEQRILDRLCQVLVAVPDTDMPRLMAILTAATLLRYPYQLPGLDRDWSTLNTVPSRYVVLLLEVPDYFGEPGALEQFREYTETLWAALRIQVLGNRNDLIWQKIAQRLMNYGTITPLYFSENTGREVYRNRAQIVEAALESSQPEPLDWAFRPRPNDRPKVRIGILRNHWLPGTESFSTLPVFEYLDRNRFEVVLYTLHPTENDLENYCGDQVAGMVALPSSLSEQVNAIRAADLDILWIGTNVTMVTNGITLLSAFRLGRVQVTSINSPTTTGFRNVDIYFGGYLSLGKSYGAYHETAIALPGSGICFSRPPLLETSAKTFPTRSDLGASDSDVVLISGANFNKLLPELREIWTRILAALPNARLVLYPYNPNWQHHYPGDHFRQDFGAQLQAAGVDPSRLVILPPMAGIADIRQCLRQGDLYLDSLPYGGATSLLDPIDVDLPMVVYEG
ncbi:MAG: glycosyltransferase, partial [Cyanobacteria bacterium P01_C01_bin.89]